MTFGYITRTIFLNELMNQSSISGTAHPPLKKMLIMCCIVGEMNCVLNDNVEKYFVKFGFQPNLGT